MQNSLLLSWPWLHPSYACNLQPWALHSGTIKVWMRPVQLKNHKAHIWENIHTTCHWVQNWGVHIFFYMATTWIKPRRAQPRSCKGNNGCPPEWKRAPRNMKTCVTTLWSLAKVKRGCHLVLGHHTPTTFAQPFSTHPHQNSSSSSNSCKTAFHQVTMLERIWMVQHVQCASALIHSPNAMHTFAIPWFGQACIQS